MYIIYKDKRVGDVHCLPERSSARLESPLISRVPSSFLLPFFFFICGRSMYANAHKYSPSPPFAAPQQKKIDIYLC